MMNDEQSLGQHGFYIIIIMEPFMFKSKFRAKKKWRFAQNVGEEYIDLNKEFGGEVGRGGAA